MLVRTDKPAGVEGVGEPLDSRFAGWRPPPAGLDEATLNAALAFSPETVALRRAILDETQFVWPRDDYLALLDIAATAPAPNDEELGA